MTGDSTTISQTWDMKTVDGVFDDVAGHLNAQHARLVANAVWMLDHVGEWQGDGLWTPEAYVMWRTGIAAAAARKIVDVARRAGEFPDCLAAMARGELSLDQIAPIVRHAPAWCDRQMAGLAPRCTVAQITKIARQYPWDWAPPTSERTDDTIDSDTTAEADDGTTVASDVGTDAPPGGPQAGASAAGPDAGATDTCWFGFDDSGRFRLHLEAGADVGLVIEAAMSEARDAEFTNGNANVTNVEALVAIANRSLDSIPSVARRNRYRINLHIDLDGVSTGPRGDALPAAVAQHLMCDGTLSPIFSADGVPVSVGRAQHIVPDRTRRIVEHRDGGCRVPGCTSRHFTEVHHIIHWSRNGPTDTWNLISLCPHHHRLHHHHKLGITGNADLDAAHPGAVVFTDAHGRILTESGARPKPPGAPPPPINGTYHHPDGGRLDTRWLHFYDDPERARRPRR